MAGQPKAPFYLAVALVMFGLIAFAVYRADIFAPEGGNGGGVAGGGPIEPQIAVAVEDEHIVLIDLR